MGSEMCIRDRIIDISKDSGHLICVKHGRFPVTFVELNVPWESVGVYRKGPITNKQIIIDPSNVHGKVLSVGNLLLTCPLNILKEK